MHNPGKETPLLTSTPDEQTKEELSSSTSKSKSVHKDTDSPFLEPENPPQSNLELISPESGSSSVLFATPIGNEMLGNNALNNSLEECSSTPEADSHKFHSSSQEQTNNPQEQRYGRTQSRASAEGDFNPSFDSSSTDPELAGIMSGQNPEDSSGANSPVTLSVLGFTKLQWSTLMIFSIADFLGGIVYSLQAPFYPQEAEKKGATATEYGLVFGVFELTMFLVSPIFGKYMGRMGARNVFNVGMFITGCCCIFFGLLDRIEDSTTFIALSFVTRIIEAVGNAGFATATFTIIACEFPDSVATTFASLETFFGLGLIVGPTMGGGLFQLGGYFLPFAVCGAMIIIVALIVAFIMPRNTENAIVEEKIKAGFGVLGILRIPGVALAAFSIIIAASSIGFLSSSLEPHIRQFELTPFVTGLVFVINGGTYALTAPCWGWLCDRIKKPQYITLFGSLFICIAFVLIGPAPFIPLKTYLWLTALGLVIQGLGVGATFVSGFVSALRISVANGFPDNVSTYGVVSGMWTSVLALGLFAGPSIAGVLMDKVGFRWGSMFVFVGGVLLMFLVILYLVLNGKKPATDSRSRDAEADPLLGTTVDTPTCSTDNSQARQFYGSTTESNNA